MKTSISSISNLDFRGFSGTVVSGRVCVGDPVAVDDQLSTDPAGARRRRRCGAWRDAICRSRLRTPLSRRSRLQTPLSAICALSMRSAVQ